MCYKSETGDEGLQTAFSPDSGSHAAPMTVQQAFAEVIGREDLTLERYEVCPIHRFIASLPQKTLAAP
jgi:tRNA-splicing endonuclease subunit Sen54